MNPTTFSILLSSLSTGTIITMTSYHWLLAWIGLEINTLAIIPIISIQHNPRSTEAATKYFLTQAAASSLILFSSLTNAWQTGTWDITQLSTTQSCILLTMALLMKLGLAPLHFWLPEVIQGTTMFSALIITTWQKLAPMSLIYLTSNNLSTTTLLTMGLFSTIIGGWAGLNQTQTRKIMAYSSIAHLGWMATITSIMTNILIMNFIIYLLLTMAMFSSLIVTKSKTIQDTSTTWTNSPYLGILMMLTLQTLGGLPPFSGFIPKWLILEQLTTQNLVPLAFFMTMATLLSLFFYLRLTYTTTLTISPNTIQTKFKWRFKLNTATSPMSMTMTTAIFLLPMTPMLLL
uniref:NADH-ubiquinone oxidoreductase chain 2 n=1 Tax=Anolis haetianus TaxID=237983 RepID=Q6X062_9SAUR|nr:NADH dehydrogenase subunit II [Anolis haetianus]